MRGSADMWRSRAKAAEAEVARLTQLLDDLGHRYAGVESSLHGASARIAELEADSKSHIDHARKVADHHQGLLDTAKREAARTATEDALSWVIKHSNEFVDDSVSNDELIERGLKALLGEGWDA